MKQPIKKRIAEANNITVNKWLYTLVVDGNNLLRISLVDKRMNDKGEVYGAVLTFLRLLGEVLKRKDFNYCIVCWDGKGSGVLRWRYYEDYKANRGKNYEMRELEKIRIPIPSIEEQSKITYFLEKETSKIDEAIAQQQKMIDLLNERKQIIINNAVTKGLDPNVKMKPSGIDWIGDIPEHWEARKLGSIGSTINGVSHDSAYFGEGYPFVSYSDVYKNVSLPKTVLGLAKSSNQERLLFSVEKGDVFFTRTSETAEEIAFSSTCLETIENAVFAGFLIRFRPKQGLIEPSFSKYYFRAYIHRSYFVKEMNLVIRASLSQQLLKGLPILLPSLKEQREIADYLDNQIIGIDSCISNINKQISLLQERKQIIINDVVTGKVKVV